MLSVLATFFTVPPQLRAPESGTSTPRSGARQTKGRFQNLDLDRSQPRLSLYSLTLPLI